MGKKTFHAITGQNENRAQFTSLLGGGKEATNGWTCFLSQRYFASRTLSMSSRTITQNKEKLRSASGRRSWIAFSKTVLSESALGTQAVLDSKRRKEGAGNKRLSGPLDQSRVTRPPLSGRMSSYCVRAQPIFARNSATCAERSAAPRPFGPLNPPNCPPAW